MTLQEFCNKITVLRGMVPFSVTSWFRTAKRNATLPSSATHSLHLLGLAVDCVLDDPDQQNELVYWVERIGGLRHKVYKSHVHIQIN